MEGKKFSKIVTIFAVIVLFAIIAITCDDATDSDPDTTTIPSVATPSAAPVGGTYSTEQTVTLTTSTSGASIYYTIDGSNPTTGSALYASPILISTTTTLKAIAVKSDMTNSGILESLYTITPLVFTDIADASAYLASLENNTSSSPVNLPINFELGTMAEESSGWRQLLDAISTSGIFVNLDLSACTMDGESFNPDLNITTGKDKIVSIVLPAAATSIVASSSFIDNTFKNFNNLKSVSGENVLTIGESAFYSVSSTSGNKNLQNIDFPKVTSIGNNAFAYCSGLQNADLPEVTNIGYAAFRGCTSLQSISFPASVTLSTVNPTFDGCSSLVSFTITGSGALSAIENDKALVRNGTEIIAYPSASGTVTMNTITTIGIYAFSGCTELQGVSFTQVTTIGNNAFDGCTNLQSVNFPLATTIGNSAFTGCKGLQIIEFPQATSIGSQAFWSCSGLQSLNIPKVTSIGGNAFSYTGTTALVITMGLSAPTLGYQIFNYITAAKTVTVKVPSSSASGYTPFSGSTVTVSDTDTTANWANGLRGGGWTGTTWSPPYSSTGPESINQNITTIIEAAE